MSKYFGASIVCWDVGVFKYFLGSHSPAAKNKKKLPVSWWVGGSLRTCSFLFFGLGAAAFRVIEPGAATCV